MKLLDILTSPWAISTEKLREIRAVYEAHLRGPKIDWKGMEARITAQWGDEKNPKECGYDLIDGVAVIPVTGVLTKGMSFFSWLFGGSSMWAIGEAVRAAIDDPSVKALLRHVDSPGRTVDGAQALANPIYQARGAKSITAFSDGEMMSGAYWIGSAADRIYISGDTVFVGSIGVVATHIDYSKQDEQKGVKYSEIVTGKYKRITSAHSPLSKEGKQTLQDMVDYIYSAFISDIARNRGVTADHALEMADEAKVYIGKQAIGAGLVDGVSTFDGLIKGLAAGDAAFYSQSEKEVNEMDLTELKTKHPAVYQEVFDAGKAEGVQIAAATVETAKAEALKVGAEAERKRIVEINAALIPGHEKIIEAAVADGKSTAGEVALKIVAAEKATRETKLAALEADGKEAGRVSGAAAPVGEKPQAEASNAKEAGDKLDALAQRIKAEKKCSYSEAFAQAEKENLKLAATYSMKKEG